MKSNFKICAKSKNTNFHVRIISKMRLKDGIVTCRANDHYRKEYTSQKVVISIFTDLGEISYSAMGITMFFSECIYDAAPLHTHTMSTMRTRFCIIGGVNNRLKYKYQVYVRFYCAWLRKLLWKSASIYMQICMSRFSRDIDIHFQNLIFRYRITRILRLSCNDCFIK